MEEEKKEQQEDKVIVAIRDEYEKKIADLELKHQEEIKKVREEEQDRSAKQIRALVSGRQTEIKFAPELEEKSDFEILLTGTKKLLGIKEEN